MPKRTDDEEVKPTRTVAAIEVEEATEEVIMTEQMLMPLSTKELEDFLTNGYAHDYNKEAGHNTHKKLRTIVLRLQKEGKKPKYYPTFGPKNAQQAEPSKSDSSIYYEAGITVNTGNYENVKITVGVTLPVGATANDITNANVTIDKAKELVMSKLEEEVSAIKSK